MAGAGDGKFQLKAQVEGLNIFSIVATTLITTILFFVILYYLKGLYFRELNAEFERKHSATFHELEDIRVEQSTRLGSYAWTDQENGFASIPITEARKEFIRRTTSGAALFPDLPQPAAAAPETNSELSDESAAGEVLDAGNGAVEAESAADAGASSTAAE